jgi:hypothetical protein
MCRIRDVECTCGLELCLEVVLGSCWILGAFLLGAKAPRWKAHVLRISNSQIAFQTGSLCLSLSASYVYDCPPPVKSNVERIKCPWKGLRCKSIRLRSIVKKCSQKFTWTLRIRSSPVDDSSASISRKMCQPPVLIYEKFNARGYSLSIVCIIRSKLTRARHYDLALRHG